MDYLLRSGKDEASSPYARMGAEYYQPDTSDVLTAFIEESIQGIGTGYGDIIAFDVEKAKRQGSPLTEEAYKASPFYRSSLPYSRDLTTESAKVLAEYNDEREKNAFIIGHASNAQTAAGYMIGFTSGIFEPKNIATGIAASAVLTPLIGSFAPAAGALKNIIRLKKSLGRYGAKAAIGGVEGMVAAAIAEPSNRYSASILKQDYTMADTLWNIGLSTAFGSGFNTIPSFIKEKWNRHGVKGLDIAVAELDRATEQFTLGQKIDIGVVERGAAGEVTKMPITQKAAAVEAFIRYTDMPEFKARFEGSKVVDETGAPLRVYHGANQEIINFNASDKQPAFFSKSPDYVEGYNFVTNGNKTIPVYLAIKNPLEVELSAREFADPVAESQYIMQARKQGNDGIIFKNTETGDTFYAISRPEQAIAAFGGDDIEAIARRIDTENKLSINKSVIESLNPENDTALDLNSARALTEYEATILDDTQIAEKNFDKYKQEIDALESQGLTTAKEDLQNALDSMNEFDIAEAYSTLQACLTRG